MSARGRGHLPHLTATVEGEPLTAVGGDGEAAEVQATVALTAEQDQVTGKFLICPHDRGICCRAASGVASTACTRITSLRIIGSWAVCPVSGVLVSRPRRLSV